MKKTKKDMYAEVPDLNSGLFQAVWDAAADMMALTDQEGAVLSVNRAYLDFFGLSREEVTGQDFAVVFADDYAEEARAQYKTLFRAREVPPVVEAVIRRKDGRERKIESRMSYLTENGRRTAMLSIVRDVTERKASQNASAHLAAIVASSEDAILSKTLEGIIVSWNAGAQRMYGYTPEEVIGRPVSILIPREHPDEFPQIMEKIRRGEAVAHYETVRIRKDGTYLDISLTVSPVKDDSGEIIGASAVARDITERTALDHRKNEFISLASHELKTPITVIKGFSQYALKYALGEGNDRLTVALKGIDENTNLITRIVTDLLDVSKIERAYLPIYPAAVDLGLLVSGVIKEIELTRPELHCTLDLPGGPLMVEADSQLIRQVIHNLIENAIKYSRDDPRVEVCVRRSAGEALTSVRDFGVGIPQAEQERVFERFYRASNAGFRSRNGLGLGLFISHGIIERHGGRIWLESSEGEGTTFYFSLPLGGRSEKSEIRTTDDRR